MEEVKQRGWCAFCVMGFLALTGVLHAQSVQPRFEQHRFVIPTCVFQDSLGFLWIGTEVGLYRYDGYRFRQYTIALNDSSAISDLWVTDIDEDHRGNLWIGTYGGDLNHYDQRTGRFVHFAHMDVWTIVTDDDGSVWLGTKDRGVMNLVLDSQGTPHCRVYDCSDTASPGPPSSDNFVLALHKDRQGYIWAGTILGGLKRLDPRTGDIRHFRHDPGNPLSLSHNTVSSICEDESGNLWIGTGFVGVPDGGGINLFDPRTERFHHLRHDDSNPASLPSDRIGSLLIDHEGTLWVGTLDAGLASIPLRGLSVGKEPSFTTYEALRWEIVTSLFEDRWGNLWISTFGSLLYKYDRHQSPFIHYRWRAGNLSSMSSTGVQSVFFDRSGNLWFGLASTGLDKYDFRSGLFTHFQRRPGDPHSISADCINGICEDESGYLWLATQGGGLNRLDPRKGTVERLSKNERDPFGLESDFVKAILMRRTGDIWVASQDQGLQLYDRARNRFSKIDIHSKNTKKVEIGSLFEDQWGLLWVGTLGDGVFRVYMENARCVDVKHYLRTPGNRNGLSYNLVCDVIRPVIMDTNAVWIATAFGLNRLDLTTDTIAHFLAGDGLASDYVLKVLEDAQGNIWCATTEGISMYDVRGGHITSYGTSEGLPFTDFGGSRQNAARGPDGQLVFSGASGSVGFYPDQLRRNRHVPPVCFTDIKTFHQSLRLETAIQFVSHITLPYSQNAISFDFAALNFTSPEKNQYAYKLEGIQDEWIYCGTERSASFTNLTPGEYIFRVKGSNNHGVWNEEGVSMAITIIPPWWRSSWAYAGYALLLLATLAGLWRLQNRRLRYQHELELRRVETEKMKELDSMKSHFFANISHEFRTPLTLILGPVSQMLARTRNELDRHDLRIMERSARRLQRLIDQLLDLARIEAGRLKLQARRVELVRFMNRVVATFESHATLRRIDLSFFAGSDRIEVYLDPEKFENVIYNLLANAFKYTPDGGDVRVSVSLRAAELRKEGDPAEVGHVEIAVSDTGIGIPPESLERIFSRFYQVEDATARELGGSGIGLALVKELVDLHRGSISVESHVQKGSTFRILLPLGRDHLRSDEIVESGAEPEVEEGLSREASEGSLPQSGVVKAVRKSGARYKATVLVVEDNPDMRAYLTGSLRADYCVDGVTDGEEGLQRAVDEIPDLVISDVMMPRMDGFELCRRLKNDERTSHIPVILLTARATSKDRVDGLQWGADDYLVKPFDLGELNARVGNLIALRRRLRERFSREWRFVPEAAPVVSLDDAFLQKCLSTVQRHLGDDQFGVEHLAREVGFSVSQLERKLIAIAGQHPNEFIRAIRLERARQLLERRAATVSEAAFEVGFNSLSHFAQSYRRKFGFSPSDTPVVPPT